MKEFTIILGYLGIGSACLPIFSLLTGLKSKTKHIEKTLVLLSIEYALVNIISVIMYFTESDQSFLFLVHYFFETILVSYFFLKKNVNKRFFLIAFFILIGVGFNLIVSQYFGSFSFDKFVSLASNIILFVISLNYILSSFNQNIHEKLTDNGKFIISTGVMFFSGIQYYFSLFESFIRSDTSVIFYYLWPIFQIGGILYYFIFTYGLWKLKK